MMTKKLLTGPLGGLATRRSQAPEVAEPTDSGAPRAVTDGCGASGGIDGGHLPCGPAAHRSPPLLPRAPEV